MDAVRDSYNQVCDRWADYRGQMPVNRCIVDFCSCLKPGAKILDVGCGTGYPIAAYLSECGFHVTGIDISENMIEKAKAQKLANAAFSVCDFLDFRTAEPYDAIIAFDSIWHIAHEKQADIYGMAASLLKAGGYFLFTHGKQNDEIIGEMFGSSFYYSALDVSDVHRLLRGNGFSVVSSIENYKEETTGDRELLIVAKKNDG